MFISYNQIANKNNPVHTKRALYLHGVDDVKIINKKDENINNFIDAMLSQSNLT